MSMSRIARCLRIFPYGRNIADVVSAVMNKDRQDAAQKRQAVVRMADPAREAKRAWGSAKAAASGSSKTVLPAKVAAPRPSKASASAKAAASGGGRPPLGGPTKGHELPSPGRRVADFGTNISVKDYLVGKFFLTGNMLQGRVRDSWLLSRHRWQNHFAIGGGKGEGSRAGPMGHLLCERRDSDSRYR